MSFFFYLSFYKFLAVCLSLSLSLSHSSNSVSKFQSFILGGDSFEIKIVKKLHVWSPLPPSLRVGDTLQGRDKIVFQGGGVLLSAPPPRLENFDSYWNALQINWNLSCVGRRRRIEGRLPFLPVSQE